MKLARFVSLLALLAAPHLSRPASAPASASGTSVSDFSSCAGANTRVSPPPRWRSIALVIPRIGAGPRSGSAAALVVGAWRRLRSVAMVPRRACAPADQRHHHGHRESAGVRRRRSRCAPARRCRRPTRAAKPPTKQQSAAIRTSGRSSSPCRRTLRSRARSTPPRASAGRSTAADAASGRIEATATTPWFGFHDDVVIRVRDAGRRRATRVASRVDVRSVLARSRRAIFG